jgi:hypothetical protein
MPVAGEDWKNIKNGKTYAIVGRCKIKVYGGEWIDGVAYTDEAGGMYSRDMAGFVYKFRKVTK